MQVWPINTGWTGGRYGTGSRLKLSYRQTWADKAAYDQTATDLAQKFRANFQKYAYFASAETLAGTSGAESVVS